MSAAVAESLSKRVRSGGRSEFSKVSNKYIFIAIATLLSQDCQSSKNNRLFSQKKVSIRVRAVMRHIISIMLQNEAGALTRVASLFSTRGYNIETLSVAPTEDPQFSRLTMVSIGPDDVIDQINKQLFKLVDVVNIADMTLGDHIERELLLLKIRFKDNADKVLPDMITGAGARVLDDKPANFTLELTGTGNQIDEFIDKVRDRAEIRAVVRSGPMAIARGDTVLSAHL